MAEPQTWYELEDGSLADPNDVAPDDAGVLRHASGVAVRMRDDLADPVPATRSVDPEAERERAKAKKRDAKPSGDADGLYRTRVVSAG